MLHPAAMSKGDGDDRASAVVVGRGAQKALEQVGCECDASSVELPVSTEPIECRIEVVGVGVRPAPATGRELHTDALVFRAGLPVNAAAICHVRPRLSRRYAPHLTAQLRSRSPNCSGRLGHLAAHTSSAATCAASTLSKRPMVVSGERPGASQYES